MNVVRTLIVMVLLLAAVNAGADGQPYAEIISRNVFGLIPVKSSTRTEAAVIDPPLRIKLHGITSVLGKRQALFTVSSIIVRPGPAADVANLVSEGEDLDGIRVIHINPATGEVTFDNHGITQILALGAREDLSDENPALVSHVAAGMRPRIPPSIHP